MNLMTNKLFVAFLNESDGIPGGKIPYGQRCTPEQRAYARKQWHKWVGIRQNIGRCITCNRKHRPLEQRCGVHRNINKAKCLKWARDNRIKIRQQYADRVKAKVCVNSPSHGPAFGNHILCQTCFVKKKAHKKPLGRPNND